jgi:hypothetical protein
MRKFAVLAFSLALAVSVHAQSSSTGFGSSLIKLFGDNDAFTSDIVIQMSSSNPNATTLPGKLAFNAGDSRLEINLAEAKGANTGPEFAQRMKAMGMEKTITISRPEKKEAYIVYPNMSVYAVSPLPDAKPASAFKTKSTELGKETVDGHPCVKNKVTVTDDEGQSHDNTVWNATDLKNFPIKIETGEPGHTTTMSFSNVKLVKPDASLFDPPANYKRYESQQALMMEEIPKRTGAMKPGHP